MKRDGMMVVVVVLGLLWSRAGQAQSGPLPDEALEATGTAVEAGAVRETPRGIGARVAVIQPLQKHYRFQALVAGSFESRLELAGWLVELGVGFAGPLASSSTTLQTAGMGALFAEVGLGRRLFEARLSPYVSVGVQPRGQYLDGTWSLQVAPYGQLGVDYAVRPTMRVFVDVRVAKHVVAVHPYRVFEIEGHKLALEDNRHVYPTEVGVQGGVQF